MTRLLEKAIKRARELPEADQDEAAEILLSLASKRAQAVRPRLRCRGRCWRRSCR